MDILGSPVGSKSHCGLWIFPAVLEGLNRLDHRQTFLLLLFCACFCKMVWYLCTIPPDFIDDS